MRTIAVEKRWVTGNNGEQERISAAAGPFDPGRLVVRDWKGTDRHRESRGSANHLDSIQSRMLVDLAADDWGVLLDDDGPGEAADIVALHARDGVLAIRLLHCKYAGGEPGARIGDLYEVCGQAQKSPRRRNQDAQPLFDHLATSAKKSRVRTGRSRPGICRRCIGCRTKLVYCGSVSRLWLSSPGVGGSGQRSAAAIAWRHRAVRAADGKDAIPRLSLSPCRTMSVGTTGRSGHLLLSAGAAHRP